MTLFLRHDAPDFEERFAALLGAKRETAAEVDAAAAEIIEAVRAEGEAALIALTERFDKLRLTPETLAFSPAEIDAACARAPRDEVEALALAAERIRAFHERQRPEDARTTDALGVETGWRWTPVDSAGLYVPGGLASYPSSVLMNAIPAQVAGVRRIVMCAPTPGGAVNPLVLAAARLGGVETVYRVGGAQAIAAMAWGAGPIRPVDKIVGPGNAWVAAAKRRVFGQVGIDSVAGPSEVLVIADARQDPEWIALDLMAQAEHDESAQSILMTPDGALATAVEQAVDALLHRLARAEIAGASWRANGAIVVVRDLVHAAELADRIAPEHLQLMVDDPEALAARVRHAGAIFLGALTPEAIGDYVAGPNHVLPTARSARFASGLSTLDFMKRTTLTRLPPYGLRAIGPAAERLARAEGLEAHALSVAKRLEALG
jgi:histidinol dehydrogenase